MVIALSTVTTHTDQSLLHQLSQGDEAAFRLIYDGHRDAVFSYARYVTKSISHAEEIVQDVFLKIWINRAEMAKVDNLASYLHILTRNHALNTLRKQAHEMAVMKELKNTAPPDQNSTAENVQFNEYRQIIYDAINTLSPQQKQVYKLSRNQGLKTQEIADQLGISPFTVKKHLVEALKNLRRILSRKIDGATLAIIAILLRL